GPHHPSQSPHHPRRRGRGDPCPARRRCVGRQPQAPPPSAVARPRPQRLRTPAPPFRRSPPPFRQRRGGHLPRESDQLLIGHTVDDLDPTRTLESLYLDPLARIVKANHGSVYRGYRRPLQLLVDIKTEGSSTYLELDRHLRRYRHLFTTYVHGKVVPGPVTAVISGDRAARVPLEAQRVRRAFYDGRLADLGTAAPASLIPLISDNWTLNFTWLGEGAFPDTERQKLRSIVRQAHTRGQKVRFWATPDLAGPARDALWTELLAADVDYFNTDDLAGLEAFLDTHR
ncbi:LOW QUALITY PROTEIN: secreted protein, partial [Streptomyces sviceus ATCC 29083]